MKKPNAKTYQHLDQVITNARFPRDGERIRQILHQAFKNIESNLNRPYELHGGSRATRDNFGAPLPHGQRDETLLRHHLIAELFRVWEIGHDEKPIINNKNNPVRPFVVFTEQIFLLLGIGLDNIYKYLEEFQSYRKAQFKASGLE